MMTNKIEITNFLKKEIDGIMTYTFFLKVRDAINISYVARRGKDEPGAIQRALNKNRIESVKQFILKGNSFYSSFIFNWVNKGKKIKITREKIIIPIENNSAQIIDGQHRMAGFSEAIKEDANINNREILIVMTENLNTKSAAKIFLNINAEQRTVKQSLVYDLFGEYEDKDYYIVRARDLAENLNNDENSPYANRICIPVAEKKRNDTLELSIIVNALKPYTIHNGAFETNHLDSHETQYNALLNYYRAISRLYIKYNCWNSKISPFLIGAGFTAATKFFVEKMIPICVHEKSFEEKTMISILNLSKENLIKRDSIKNVQGKEQQKMIYEFLVNCMVKKIERATDYKF